MKQEKKLEEAKRLYKDANADQRYVLESLFPELAEIEDVRIRKRIIHALHGDVLDMEETAKAIAWLEKQGWQKPAEWSEEDDYNLQCLIAKVTSDIQKGNVGRNNELIDWLKSLKDRVQPKKEWSKEELQTIKDAACFVLSCVNTAESKKEEERLEELADKLQDLRPKNTWKPSEEQMKVLDIAIRCGIQLGSSEEIVLKGLLKQLKQL